jgi:hypothetical protein
MTLITETHKAFYNNGNPTLSARPFVREDFDIKITHTELDEALLKGGITLGFSMTLKSEIAESIKKFFPEYDLDPYIKEFYFDGKRTEANRKLTSASSIETRVRELYQRNIVVSLGQNDLDVYVERHLNDCTRWLNNDITTNNYNAKESIIEIMTSRKMVDENVEHNCKDNADNKLGKAYNEMTAINVETNIKIAGLKAQIAEYEKLISAEYAKFVDTNYAENIEGSIPKEVMDEINERGRYNPERARGLYM